MFTNDMTFLASRQHAINCKVALKIEGTQGFHVENQLLIKAVNAISKRGTM